MIIDPEMQKEIEDKIQKQKNNNKKILAVFVQSWELRGSHVTPWRVATGVADACLGVMIGQLSTWIMTNAQNGGHNKKRRCKIAARVVDTFWVASSLFFVKDAAWDVVLKNKNKKTKQEINYHQ